MLEPAPKKGSLPPEIEQSSHVDDGLEGLSFPSRDRTRESPPDFSSVNGRSPDGVLSRIAERALSHVDAIMTESDYSGLPGRLDRVIRNLLMLEGSPRDKIARALGSLELMAKNQIQRASFSALEIKFGAGVVVGLGIVAPFVVSALFGGAAISAVAVLGLFASGLIGGGLLMHNYLSGLSSEIENSRPS